MSTRVSPTRLTTVIVLVLLTLALGACAKKKPASSNQFGPPTSSSARSVDVGSTGNDFSTGDPAAPHNASGELDPALIGAVYFDFDEYELNDGARAQLARNAEYLKAHPELRLSVEGHCDERGTSEYNIALGARRAEAARTYLITLGIDGSRLKSMSYGEENPFCTDSNERCWSQNRRAHFAGRS